MQERKQFTDRLFPVFNIREAHLFDGAAQDLKPLFRTGRIYCPVMDRPAAGGDLSDRVITDKFIQPDALKQHPVQILLLRNASA